MFYSALNEKGCAGFVIANSAGDARGSEQLIRQKLIDAYNAGSQNIEAFFQQLLDLTQGLAEEERRAMREGPTEEELALFDILAKPVPELTEKDRAESKRSISRC